jgi:arsenate reductase
MRTASAFKTGHASTEETFRIPPQHTGESAVTDADVVIYHNPECETSRETLAKIRAAGIEPKVMEYLKDGWTKSQLKDILAKLGKRPRDILHLEEDQAHEDIINNPNSTDDEILDAMIGHPILVERPIVITPRGAVLARPADLVEPLLQYPDPRRPIGENP